MDEPGAARATGRQTGSEGVLIDGRYRVERKLGAGGMATVFRVVDESTGRRLALKQLIEADAAEQAKLRSRLRFRFEFHTMARLRHPCIVDVHDYGIADGVPYYTMELLEGQELKRMCPLDPVQACRVLRDIAAALAFLHARGLVHRDVAPGNVRCASSGRAKLIDFGVITTVGVPGEIAGTVPFLAPESLLGMPVDHRADLFGLGALAYWLLTARHAFTARKLPELEAAWKRTPPPPSTLTLDVPEALDRLVMGLLSVDPLGRPSTAAEVVDRLGAIAGLDPAPEIEVVSSYLSSAAMVGRREEMGRLRRRVARLVGGRGAAVVIEAPSGAGKSRILREVALEAQVAGATVINVSSESGRGPYGVARALARDLLAATGNVAVEAATTYVPVIGRVLPEVRARFPDVALAPLSGSLREDRMLLQAELAAWIEAVARQRKLVILVDDVQRCDEASAAVLAALAHGGRPRLLQVVALRTDEEIRAPDAVASLRDSARRMHLRGLSADETRELVAALFGDVPGMGRLAPWMHEVSGGGPLHCIELARHLVDRGAVRFADGVWVVSENFDRGDVPGGLREALDARVAMLPPAATAVAEVLGVHGGELALELCMRLTDLSEDEAFGVLGELEHAGILVRSEQGYRFSHDGVREALLRRLSDDRRRDLHRRIGEALAGDDLAPEQEAEVGWHLLRGGEEQRGAVLLDRAGVRFYETQSFADALPLLEAVLDVYRRHRAPRRVCLELQRRILIAACVVDRTIALRHADATIAAFAKYAGLSVAARVGRVFGRAVGLLMGMGVAWLRWLLTLPGRRGPPPMEAIHHCLQATSYAAAVYTPSYDVAGVEALVHRVEPLSVVRNRIPEATWLMVRCFLHYVLGRFPSLEKDSDRVLHIFQTDRNEQVSQMDRNLAIGAMHVLRMLSAFLERYPTEEQEKLRALNLRYFEPGSLQVRVAHHRWRGEEDEAHKLESRAEMLYVQLGAVWQIEAWLAATSGIAYAHNYDVLGLKRTIERLDRLIASGYAFGPFLELARGEYYRERGDVKSSLAALQGMLRRLPERELLLQIPARVALAETLLAAGEPAEARKLAAEVHRTTDSGRLPHRLRAARIEALAAAELGDVAGAIERVDAALVEATAHGFPSVCGLLHEVRARLAARANDTLGFGLHVAEMKRYLRATGNPALVARIDRIGEQAPRGLAAAVSPSPTSEEHTVDAPSPALIVAGSPGASPVTQVTKVSVRNVSAELARTRTPFDRAERALALLVSAADGASGHLYLLRRGEVQLAAPARGDELDGDAMDALRRALAPEHRGAPPDSDWPEADVTTSERDAAGPAPFLVVPLRARLPDRVVLVGAAAIQRGERPLRSPNRGLCAELARVLYEAGDAGQRDSA